jgi:hypothetical protein
MSVARLVVLEARTHPVLVVIAHYLIPGNRGIDPRSVEGLLIVDAGSAKVNPRAGRNDLAVDGVDKPAQFVVLGIICGIAQRETEVEGRHLVQRVDGLYGSIKHLRRRQNDRRIRR